MPKVHELKKERANKAAEARKIVDLAVSEGRDNTPDEQSLIDGIFKDIESRDRQIAVLEKIDTIEDHEKRSREDRSTPLYGNVLPDLSGKHTYSVLRAMRCMLGIEKGGLELEVSQEIARRSGKNPEGVFIPWNLATGTERRDLNTSAGSGAIANILGTDLIQILRNKMVLNSMGARVLTDMTGGTFSLPKQTATTTAYYVAEGTAPNTSNLTLAQVTWTPRTLGAVTNITRKFVLQTSVDAEAMARNDLAQMIAVELDRVALNGSGSGQQPLGILQDPNVPTVALGTNGGLPTWANVVNLEKQVAVSNAEFGKLGYITSNGGRAIMKQTPKVGSTFPVFLWENDNDGEGMVNGRRAVATEQVPSNLTKGSASGICTAIAYGNWDSATYAFWSGLDIMLDPYSGSSSGSLKIVALQDFDVQYRYESSFAKTVDMLMA